MNQQPKLERRGAKPGSNNGGGRKPLPEDEKKVWVTISLSQEHAALTRGKNRSKLVSDGLNFVLAPLERKLDGLTDDERLEVFAGYCLGCGTNEEPCYCQRDE